MPRDTGMGMRQIGKWAIIGGIAAGATLLQGAAVRHPATAPVTAPAATAAVHPVAEDNEALQQYLVQLAGTHFKGISRVNDRCTLVLNMNTGQLARLLQQLTATDRPLRQERMVVQSRKPGVDDLDVEIDVTFRAPPRASAPLLFCLRDVTALFPAVGNTIWANAFTVDDNQVDWTLEGECTAEQFAGDLCDAMTKAAGFKNPKVTVAPSKTKDGQFTYRLTSVYQPAVP